MKWLSLDSIKRNSRIEDDYENELLTSYGQSAEDTVLNYLNRSYQDVIEQYGGIPEPVAQASLMLVDTWYQHRSPIESINISLVPYTFDILLKPYMKLTSRDEDGMEVFTLGSDVKILVDAELSDGMKMEDVDFDVTVYNADMKDVQHEYTKAQCLLTTDGNYIVLVDSEDLGIGLYMVKVTFKIPDTDYVKGYRKEVVRINPHVKVTG